VPDERVQVPAGEPVNVPDLSLVNVTVPVGVVATPEDVSVTATVQLVGMLTVTEEGMQVNVVLVVLRVKVTVAVPLLVA
jgi:hypothetical protein